MKKPSNDSQPISFGRRLAKLASTNPEKAAVVYVSQSGHHREISWRTLERTSNQAAHLLESFGVRAGEMIAIALRNSPEHFFFTFAAWKLGACPLPISPDLPVRERNEILDLARPVVTVCGWKDAGRKFISPSALLNFSEQLSENPVDDRISNPGKAIGSGGSTGRPKIIVTPGPWVRSPDEAANRGPVQSMARWIGFYRNQVQLVAAPLYHNAPFTWAYYGLFDEHLLIVMERFDAERAVDLIERYRVNWGFLVPTMMRRIIRLPNIHSRDLRSLSGVYHSGAPCPEWLRRAWIDLIGGDRLFEAYGATEAIGATYIRGDEWLNHVGSVGKPADTEIRILDENGHRLPSGEVGEIFMKLKHAQEPTYYYIGSPPAKTTVNGFASVGDLGYLDEQGYLFLADRSSDLILSGGANVYPAEVEAALSGHPDVYDVAVIGLPDDDWGHRVHAVIQPRNFLFPPSIAELDAYCRERLISYKTPKSYDFVESLPRQESGKLRRRTLAMERLEQGHWNIQIPQKTARETLE